MLRTFILALSVTSYLLASAAVASAGDFCIAQTPGDNVIVLKGFALPGKGACKAANGFYQSGPYFTSGTACGSSDGVSVRFVLMTLVSDVLVTETFALLRSTPTSTVSGRECDSDGGNCANDSYAQTTCSASKVPVPQ